MVKNKRQENEDSPFTKSRLVGVFLIFFILVVVYLLTKGNNLFLGSSGINQPTPTIVLPTEIPTHTPIPTLTPIPTSTIVPAQQFTPQSNTGNDAAYKATVLLIVQNCINNEDAIIQNGIANGTITTGVQYLYKAAITGCYQAAGLTPPAN